MDADASSERGHQEDCDRLHRPPDMKRRKITALKGGRIAGQSNAQVRCEQLRKHLQILHLQKAKKKEEAHARPTAEELSTNPELREHVQVNQIRRRRDPDSPFGEPLKTEPGSEWAWNLFLRAMETGEEEPTDVIDWATLVTDELLNNPDVQSKFECPTEFEVTADETREPLRRADEVIVDEDIAAMLVDMHGLRHPKVRRTLNIEARWSAALEDCFSDVGRGLSAIRAYLEKLDRAE